MGFGFNLLFVFILLPITAILLIAWLFTKQKMLGIILKVVWGCILGVAIISGVIQKLTAKTILEKKDFYGQYIVDRNYFPGKQADWQYNHFRFEIKDNDSIYFYVTQNERIVKSFYGTITTLTSYSSDRIIIRMQQPSHHILATNPTVYRSAWRFCLVFDSKKYGNMFFHKTKWKHTAKN